MQGLSARTEGDFAISVTDGLHKVNINVETEMIFINWHRKSFQ